MSGANINDIDDYNMGKSAINYFHNSMSINFPQKYGITLDELIRILQARTGQKYFLEGLGLGIISTGMSDKSVSDAMKSLALKSNGMIPASNAAFTNYLVDSAVKINWIDMPVAVLKDTAIDVVEGIQKVGDKVIEGGEGILDLVGNAKILIPVLFVLALGGFLYLNRVSR